MIPVSEPWLGERERAYVDACMQSGWISSAGEFFERFEADWAAYCGRRYGIAVANGTVALQLGIAALDLEPGDEVIMPSFTIISCALAVLYAGGVPVLVDSDPDTWCMDVDAVEAAISNRTRAIMPVHIYGHPVDMSTLLALARRHDLKIVEDAAEAHGAECLVDEADEEAWRRCGSFGELSCFSFYANKIVTTGEGGMVLTDDETLAERLRGLRNLGFGPRRFVHHALGFNFRMTNLQAAIGVAQIEKVEETIRRKRGVAAAYTARLREVGGLQLPVERDWARNVYWMYGVVLDGDADVEVDALQDELRTRGVETRPFFFGLHEQPVLRARGLYENAHFPTCERLGRRGLYLPSSPQLSDSDVDRVCASLAEALATGRLAR